MSGKNLLYIFHRVTWLVAGPQGAKSSNGHGVRTPMHGLEETGKEKVWQGKL